MLLIYFEREELRLLYNFLFSRVKTFFAHRGFALALPVENRFPTLFWDRAIGSIVA
jgi:hypothetical protein